ncbi:hypothetical protein C8J57DRAFT_766453 [Mycena rebaudengoi]|nr:hypothetical protein C8J57DRAFT_766453 [Mycena rebaudengoi]
MMKRILRSRRSRWTLCSRWGRRRAWHASFPGGWMAQGVAHIERVGWRWLCVVCAIGSGNASKRERHAPFFRSGWSGGLVEAYGARRIRSTFPSFLFSSAHLSIFPPPPHLHSSMFNNVYLNIYDQYPTAGRIICLISSPASPSGGAAILERD